MTSLFEMFAFLSFCCVKKGSFSWLSHVRRERHEREIFDSLHWRNKKRWKFWGYLLLWPLTELSCNLSLALPTRVMNYFPLLFDLCLRFLHDVSLFKRSPFSLMAHQHFSIPLPVQEFLSQSFCHRQLDRIFRHFFWYLLHVSSLQSFSLTTQVLRSFFNKRAMMKPSCQWMYVRTKVTPTVVYGRM